MASTVRTVRIVAVGLLVWPAALAAYDCSGRLPLERWLGLPNTAGVDEMMFVLVGVSAVVGASLFASTLKGGIVRQLTFGVGIWLVAFVGGWLSPLLGC